MSSCWNIRNRSNQFSPNWNICDAFHLKDVLFFSYLFHKRRSNLQREARSHTTCSYHLLIPSKPLWVRVLLEASSTRATVPPGHSLLCSTEHAPSTPLLLLLPRRLPTPSAWCGNGHTQTQHGPPTCPHAHRHVNTQPHTHSRGTIWLSAVCPPAPPTQLS